MKCHRCGSVMVYEKFFGHDENYSGWRCISCGEIIDKVIRSVPLPLKNEYTKIELMKICENMINGSDKFLKLIGGSIKVKVILLEN